MPSQSEAKVYEYTLPDAGMIEANSLYARPTRMQRVPAMTKEIERAGPAYLAAAMPVKTKIPAPMMPPTPKKVKSRAPKFLLKLDWSDSAWS